MSSFWVGLGLTCLIVGALGYSVWRIFPNACKCFSKQAVIWVTVAASILMAALVGFAFLAESLAEHDKLPDPGGGLTSTTQQAGQLFLNCVATLWFGWLWAACPKHGKSAHWLAGCLLVATAGILIFLPSAVYLLWEVAEASVDAKSFII